MASKLKFKRNQEVTITNKDGKPFKAVYLQKLPLLGHCVTFFKGKERIFWYLPDERFVK